MKNFFKTNIFILIIAVYFCALNVFAANPAQFPDVLRLQPIPSGVHPSNPGNINKSELNSENNSLLLSQMSQYEFDESKLDPNTSYINTTDHILFIADTDNNRVFVFNLNSDNVLIDYVPDYVLGQPDFTNSDPGTTQSALDGPTGLAYDPGSNKLFVADTNNNRIMIFGDVNSISDGEDVVDIVSLNENSAISPSIMSPPIIARMQSKPKIKASSPRKNVSSSSSTYLWLIIFLIIIVLVILLFLYTKWQKREKALR